jgi:excisionase family DNA binding protein
MNLDTSKNNNTSPVEEMTTPSQNLWRTREVAEFLRVSVKTVFNQRKKGLPFVQVGGAVRFVPQEIKDYLANSRHSSLHRLRQIIRKREASQ